MRPKSGTGTMTTTAGKNATQVSLFLYTPAHAHSHYPDEEYEWEYIESDEENNQKAKADENKATVSLPAKVNEFPYILLFKSYVLNLVHSPSQAESLPNIADKESSIYLNRDRFARSEKDEDAASEGNKRDKGSQEFIDISEVTLLYLSSTCTFLFRRTTRS